MNWFSGTWIMEALQPCLLSCDSRSADALCMKENKGEKRIAPFHRGLTTSAPQCPTAGQIFKLIPYLESNFL